MSVYRNEHHREFSKEIPPNVSIFSDLQVAERFDEIRVMFQYGLSDFDVVQHIQGDGVISQNDAVAVVSSGSVGFSALDSRLWLRYMAGHEGFGTFTCTFSVEDGVGMPDSHQYIGLMGDDNGYFLGFRNEVFGVGLRRDGVEEFIARDDFNGDKLDGMDGSKFRPNYENFNVWRIRFGWLGSAVILYEVCKANGEWITFHKILYPSSSTLPSIHNPVLSVRVEVEREVAGDAVVMTTGSWNAGTVGGLPTPILDRYFQHSFEKNVSAGVKTNIFTLRSKENFNDRENRIRAVPIYLSVATDSSANVVHRIEIVSDAEISGTQNFVDVDSLNSVMEVDSDGDIVSGGNTEAVWAMSRVDSIAVHIRDLQIMLYPNQTLTFSAESGGEVNVLVSLRWGELF